MARQGSADVKRARNARAVICLCAQMTPPLDDLDRKIIDVLERHGRATLAQVGEAVGLSASAIKRRLDRLESSGVIAGYAAVVNPAALGARLEAFVELYCAESVAPVDLVASVGGM